MKRIDTSTTSPIAAPAGSPSRLAFIADLHIRVNRYEQSERILGEIVSGIIRERVNIAVFTGDVFNSYRDYNAATEYLFRTSFKTLREAGVKIVVINGGHDLEKEHPEWPAAVMPLAAHGAHIFTMPGMLAAAPDVQLYLIPWLRKSALYSVGEQVSGLTSRQIYGRIHEKIVTPFFERHEGAPAQFSGLSVLVYHASVTGAKLHENEIAADDFTLDPAMMQGLGCDYIVGGHFHQRQEWAPRCWYVGAPDRWTFGERDNPAGWMLIAGDEEPRFIDVKAAQKFSQFFPAAVNPDAAYILRNVPDVLEGNVKIRFSCDKENAPDIVMLDAELKRRGAANIVFDPQYTNAAVPRMDGVSAQTSVGDMLVRYLEQDGVDAGGRLRALEQVDPAVDHIGAMLEAGKQDVCVETPEHLAEIIRRQKTIMEDGTCPQATQQQ